MPNEHQLDLDALFTAKPENKTIMTASPKRSPIRPSKMIAVCFAALVVGLLIGAFSGFLTTGAHFDPGEQKQRDFLLNEAIIPYYEDADGNILPAGNPITLAQAEGMTTQRLASLAVHTEDIADLYLAGKFKPQQYPVIATLAERLDAVIALNKWVHDSDWQVALIAQYLQSYCESHRML